MSKNSTAGNTASRSLNDKKQDPAPFKGVRQILFPTEPSTIGNKKIDRAVERVIARKK